MVVCNVGKVDRYVRGMIGFILIAIALLFIQTTLPKVVVLFVATLFFLSAWFGVCLIYRALGLNTAPKPTHLEA